MDRFSSPSPYLAAMVAVLLTAVLIAGSAGEGKAQEGSLKEPLIVRIYYEQLGDLNQLRAFDIFEYNNLEKQYVLAAVSGAELAKLQDGGWSVVEERPFWLSPSQQSYYDGYRTVDELYQDMMQANTQNPALTELVSYGRSYCYTQNGCETPSGEQTAGHELLAMRVTNEAVPGTSVIGNGSITRGEKPVFFLLANIHARELTTAEIAMRWLDLLLDQYGQDADITWLVDWHELWIIPTANPDGHWITELDTADGYPLLHRKNFDRDADEDGVVDCDVWPSLSYSQFGVDLNRNSSFAWQDPGSMTSACEQTYSGPAPASEPEVAALQEIIADLFDDRRGPGVDDPADENSSGLLLTLHSYGNMVLRPWAFMGDAPPNEESLKAIGDKLAGLSGYHSCRSPECLYFSSGTTDDWAYGELGIPAFTFEIGMEEEGFRPPYTVIDAHQWPENRAAFLYAARIARAPYQLAHGPDAVNLAVVVNPGGEATAEVLIESSGEIVKSAEYSIDVPFWNPGVEPQPMNALDDQAGITMAFTADLDTGSLTPGRHTIFVRGNYTGGHTGPTSAAFFEIRDTGDHTNSIFLPILSSQFRNGAT